jgi:hypothetical protein
MPLPVIHGLIRRRILVSFRIDPAVAQRQLPPPFRPKLVGGDAIGGLCLIRLEQVRPGFVPLRVGLQSENAAHRFAVCWTDAMGVERDSVYIPRRDTDSRLNQMAGGRLFPGESHRARFDVQEAEGVIHFAMQAADGEVCIRLRARAEDAWPGTSRFGCVEEASAFYRAGSVGYSPTRGERLEGMALETETWRVQPLAVEEITASYFEDPRRFPPGSIAFDSALLMRDIPHAWRSEPGLAAALPVACVPQWPGGRHPVPTD